MAKPIDKEYLKKALKNFDEEILGNKYLQEKDTKVQADWNETDTASEAFIKNKPEIISEERVTALETPTFVGATTRANIASGESTKTILGKIKKYFADLKSHAFNAPANNLTTTAEGYALDARQGKTLQDKIGSTDISTIGDGTVTNAISTINSNLGKKANYITLYDTGVRVSSCEIPSLSTGVYIITITDLYNWSRNYWIGVMRIRSTSIAVLNKISGGGSMDDATVSGSDRTITLSSNIDVKIQKIVAIQVADV